MFLIHEILYLANQLWCSDSLTRPTPLIILPRLPALLESLMPLKNWCSIHAKCSKSSLKHSIDFCGIFPSLKQNCIAYRSPKVSSRPDCTFEIHQLWQSGFRSLYSNLCGSCSFEPWIIKICHSSHKMYRNNILNFQVFQTILKLAQKKKYGNLLKTYRKYIYIYIFIYTHSHTHTHAHIYIYIYIYMYVCMSVLTSIDLLMLIMYLSNYKSQSLLRPNDQYFYISVCPSEVVAYTHIYIYDIF